MRKMLLLTAVAVMVGTAFLAGLLIPGPPTRQCVEVLRVIDGDTVLVRRFVPEPFEDRVRLLRIDTPERGDPGHKEAAETLRRLVEGKKITLEFEQVGVLERDRYGRLLAYLLADGQNVNVEMVRLGWSRFITTFGKGRYVGDFRQAEAEARAQQRGIWGFAAEPIARQLRRAEAAQQPRSKTAWR